MIPWTPKVCKIVAFMAVIMGLGLLFYILLGFRSGSRYGSGLTVQGLRAGASNLELRA